MGKEEIMKQLPIHKSLEAFGKDMFVLEIDETDTEKKIPLYADGFPGGDSNMTM
jgi:hypothetical protein